MIKMSGNTSRGATFFLLAMYLLIPCLLSYTCWQQFFPYGLNGRQFLWCYLWHMASTLLLLYLGRVMRAMHLLPLLFLVFTVVLSVARLVQGVSHEKPVGYLVLFFSVHCVILLLCVAQKRRQQA